MIALLFTIAVGHSPPSDFELAQALQSSQEIVAAKQWGKESFKQAVNRSTRDSVPLVVMFTASWCGPCQAMKRNVLKRWDKRKDIAFVEVDIDASPVIWRKYRKGESLPQFASWKDPRVGRAHRFTGQTTAAKLEVALGIARPAKAKAKPIQQRGTAQGSWTWPGHPSVASLERHLAEPPHNYSSAYLSGLSDSELVQLHDAWHNRTRNAQPTVKRPASRNSIFRRGRS